jgi:hypothetical protein
MAAGDTYRKTALGLAEIKDRKLKLSPRLRTMLILVDGAQTEEMLQEGAVGVGAPPDFIAQLITAGLIERVGGAPEPAARPVPAAASRAPEPRANDAFSRFREAKAFMNSTIVDAMGLKSFMFTMKLERANSLAELEELVDAYHAALAGAKNEGYASMMTTKLKEMLR